MPADLKSSESQLSGSQSSSNCGKGLVSPLGLFYEGPLYGEDSLYRKEFAISEGITNSIHEDSAFMTD